MLDTCLTVSIVVLVLFTAINLVDWGLLKTASTLVTTIVAILGLLYVKRTWEFEKQPRVHAVGVFIISTKQQTNKARDQLIKDYQTFQLVNIGRGPAGNVVLSVRRDESGKLLEDYCPHTFAIPANYGTFSMKEVLHVHGQRFVSRDPYVLESDNGDYIFYISYRDHEGVTRYTRVKVSRVKKADGLLGEVISKYNSSLMMWKVIENIDI